MRPVLSGIPGPAVTSGVQRAQNAARPVSFGHAQQEEDTVEVSGKSKAGVTTPVTRALKWGGLTALAGVGLMIVSPFSGFISLPMGCAAIAAAPVAAILGFISGTISLGKRALGK